MSCDFSALQDLDASDPDQINALLQQCQAVAFDPTLWFWAIVLTVAGALGGAWIGKRKNAVARDTILGAALGPIGWAISWFLPVQKPKPTCPACKRAVDAGDAHCRYCGAQLGA